MLSAFFRILVGGICSFFRASSVEDATTVTSPVPLHSLPTFFCFASNIYSYNTDKMDTSASEALHENEFGLRF